MNHFRKLYSHRGCIAVLSIGLSIVFSDPAWSTLTVRDISYPYQVSGPPSGALGTCGAAEPAEAPVLLRQGFGGYPHCSMVGTPLLPAKAGDSPGIHLSRRQKGPPQMDEDTQSNWRTYQGLTPDDKNRLRDKSQKWQSLPPEQQKEMRRRMERYRELPPQDQERYQKRYKQWQSLPPEDRDRIRDRLRHWDSLSPQEKEDVLRRFQKR